VFNKESGVIFLERLYRNLFSKFYKSLPEFGLTGLDFLLKRDLAVLLMAISSNS
jgi:hypothetical protein